MMVAAVWIMAGNNVDRNVDRTLAGMFTERESYFLQPVCSYNCINPLQLVIRLLDRRLSESLCSAQGQR
jgi:hypothetical protein